MTNVGRKVIAGLAFGPVALLAGALSLTFLKAAATARRSDGLVWLALGAFAAVSVSLCVYGFVKSSRLRVYWLALILVLSLVCLWPSLSLLIAFAKNPP